MRCGRKIRSRFWDGGVVKFKFEYVEFVKFGGYLFGEVG